MSQNSEPNRNPEPSSYLEEDRNLYPQLDDDPVQPYRRTRSPELSFDAQQFLANMKEQQEAFFFALNNSFSQVTSQMSALMQVMVATQQGQRERTVPLPTSTQPTAPPEPRLRPLSLTQACYQTERARLLGSAWWRKPRSNVRIACSAEPNRAQATRTRLRSNRAEHASRRAEHEHRGPRARD